MDETKTVSRPMNVCFENIPEEVLIEIFTYLPFNDLKRVMMSSHAFNNLIGQSTILMKKCSMKISPKRKWDFKSIENLSRKHQNVKLLDFKIDESEEVQLVIEGLNNVGRFVKHFELTDCGISMNDLISTMKTMEQLTRVDLTNVKGLSGELNELPALDFLMHLRIIECDCCFEIFKRARKLQEVHFQADHKNTDLKSFKEMLSNQTTLKKLYIINLKFSNIFEQDVEYPFQLQTLTVQNCHFKKKENFCLFLYRQRGLEEVDLTVNNMKLNLDRIRYFEDFLITVTRKRLLKSLSLEINDYNFINNGFLNNGTNENVRNLKLNLEQTNFLFVSILKLFPNIESLDISIKNVDPDTIEYLNKNLLHLRSLKVTKFPSEAFAKLKIKTLNSLHINETNVQVDHWLEFLKNNPNIIRLVINFAFFMDIPDDFIDTITKKLKLEHLELIDKFIGMDNDVYELICENCKNLKYLKLWNINVEKNFDEHDKDYLRSRNVRFHLFNDESLNTPMIPF